MKQVKRVTVSLSQVQRDGILVIKLISPTNSREML